MCILYIIRRCHSVLCHMQYVNHYFLQLKPERTIIEVWSDPYVMSMAVEAGFRVVFAQCWYLDHVHGERPDWEQYYNCDPAKLFTSSSYTGK